MPRRAPEADAEYSKAPRRLRPGAAALRTAIAGVAGIGALLLIVAEFVPLLSVATANGRVVGHVTGGANNGYALLVLGLVALGLAAVTARAEKALRLRSVALPVPWLAALALALVGVVAILIAVLGDLPDTRAVGLLAGRLGEGFASPATGFYAETLGAALLIVSAVARLMLPGEAGMPRRGRPDPNVPDRPDPGARVPAES